MLTIPYTPKAIIIFPISTFGIPFTIVDGLKVTDNPSLDGNLLSKSTTTYISDLVIRVVYILNGTVYSFSLPCSLIYILTVQLFQHVSFLRICIVNQVVRTFLMF